MARGSVQCVVSGLLVVMAFGCREPTLPQNGNPAQLANDGTQPPDSGGPAQSPDSSGSQQTRWIDDRDLFSTGLGQVSFVARAGNRLTAWIYRSTGYQPGEGPVWFVMHGVNRDADRYIAAAAPVAERHNALAIAVQFSTDAYPTSEDYTLGIDGPGGWLAPEDMVYAEIESAFDLVRTSLRGSQAGYYLFGHSAGAQFTHRLLTFLRAPRVLGAVSANAGWYTLPTTADPRVHRMPYGLIGGPVAPAALAGLFGTRLTVLLGEQDISTSATDADVRGTPEAEAQGPNRLQRGHHYFAVGRAQAAALGMPFRWRRDVVPRTGHDADRMIASAGFLTFVPGAQPCLATPAAGAAGLTITEILADPAAGTAGDANRDGVRDANADEFVEIVNGGTGPVCLAGWTLGDASSPDRHVFPLGAALAPGQYVVVFGGGIPTGRFGGAQVQWSTEGLSLQNGGDVLTLRSADGTVVQRVSWGTCAGTACATDHWSGGLGIAGSLSRNGASAPWSPHAVVAGVRYSPGFGATP